MQTKNTLLLLLIIVVGCRKPKAINDNMDSYDERLSGGQQTTFNESFDEVFPILSPSKTISHDLGDGIFSSTFVTAPNPFNPGLGPIFNNVSCNSCHTKGGVGKPPQSGVQELQSLLFKLSMPGFDAHGHPNYVPNFGAQLQTKSIYGTQPEGKVNISYALQQDEFADGELYNLQKPTYTIVNPYKPINAGFMMSPRLPLATIGMGLLEALPDEWMLQNQDVSDANNDGISGKINYVWNQRTQSKTIGRFGWKATIPSVEQQVALAFQEDMGITNPLFPIESSYNQFQLTTTTTTDVDDSIISVTTLYMQTIAVPARRNVNDVDVQKGKQIFKELNCSGCHVMTARTTTNMAFAEVSNQVIYPFTDLLLHDMGQGLSDNRPDYDAQGNEWRTPPLWGIGLSQKINGNTNYLHDGRARNLQEAILWHGGEAELAKNNYRLLSKTDRTALIKFLQSL
jgi:CxxC motif-containing protein (DUF1111 family)